jgi:hypothetical protein
VEKGKHEKDSQDLLNRRWPSLGEGKRKKKLYSGCGARNETCNRTTCDTNRAWLSPGQWPHSPKAHFTLNSGTEDGPISISFPSMTTNKYQSIAV